MDLSSFFSCTKQFLVFAENKVKEGGIWRMSNQNNELKRLKGSVEVFCGVVTMSNIFCSTHSYFIHC